MVEELPRHRAETAPTLLTGVLVKMTQMSDAIQLLISYTHAGQALFL